MKKCLVVSLSAFAGSFLALAIIGIPLHVRAGGGATPSENGDVNGDGMIDVSDAVYTLLYLFKGGPAPVACADSPELVARIAELEVDLTTAQNALVESQTSLVACQQDLQACTARGGPPDTGQKLCYDADGNEVLCSDPACPGQDGFYAAGCPSEDHFVDNGDGTVTDTCTGLMWQRDMADVNGDDQRTDQDSLHWCDALAYCENLSFADHSDWRLPNVRELQSIADYGRFNPTIDPVFGAVSGDIWSSSTFVNNPIFAWHVYFFDGDVNLYGTLKTAGLFVRAVRSGP